MAGINFLGSYSGIDQSTVDKLMAAERLPLNGMNTKKQDYTIEKNAWKDINTRMNTLSTKINELKDEHLFTDKKVVSSVDGIVSVSVDNDAIEGTYEIEVTKLATNESIVGETITWLDEGNNPKELKLYGDLNISIGDESVTINIGEDDTLKDIVDSINCAKTSGDSPNELVSASIIDSRLVIKSLEAGDKEIELTGTDEAVLQELKFNDGTKDTITTIQGSNSEFTINGISVTKNTNTISDVVDGLTFTLTDEETTTLTVSKDYSALESKIESVVEQYNSTMSFMQSKSKSGTPDVPGSKGDLAGDSALQRLISNLRTSVSSTISGITSEYKNASSIGIKTIDNEGTLSFDKTIFEEAMSNDVDAVQNFFSDEDCGFATKLDGFLEYYIDNSDGIIASKKTSLDSMIKTVDKKIDAFNDRMEAKEAYYIKIFASLDAYMAKAESTTSWLTSQMGSMNSSGNQ